MEIAEKDGWQDWFTNSTHPLTKKLIKDLELVANVDEGLSNVTKAFFWPYAFLGSRSQLEYIVEGNFTNEYGFSKIKNKYFPLSNCFYFRNLGRSTALHIGDECLSIFGISYIMPKNAVYANRLNDAILRLQENGLIAKEFKDLQWDVQKQRGRTAGALLKAASSKQFKTTDTEERGLTLADTEGMFLLMGIGYLIAGSVLMSEVIGGCANKCRKIARRVSVSMTSNEADSFKANTTRSSYPDTMRFKPLYTISGLSSSDTMKLRRKSDQTEMVRSNDLKGILNGHRRHNSLVDGVGVRKRSCSVTFNERRLLLPDIGNISSPSSGKMYHTVEINRIPTPFSIEETFGEKVFH